MMQHRITMGDKFDLERALPVLAKAAHLRDMKATMLLMAGANQPGEAEWFVLQTENRREKTVHNLLSDKNILCYLPLVEGGKAVRRHRVVTLLDRPALPGYLMVSIVPSIAAFCGLRWVDGVVGIVGGVEKPHRVSEKDLNRFKIALGSWDANAAHAETFSVNDWVRFDEGPFVGFSGRIVKLRKAVLMRGLKPVAVEGMVQITVNDQTHTISSPLALLQKI